jgi:hypothetical protein
LRRFPARKLLAVVAGGVDGVKLCTTLLLSLPPLVLVDESSSSAESAAPLCCCCCGGACFFSLFFFATMACFFRMRKSPEVLTICAAHTSNHKCGIVTAQWSALLGLGWRRAACIYMYVPCSRGSRSGRCPGGCARRPRRCW